jgi:hypothetical protein
MDTLGKTLETFAENFIVSSFRDRFVHEAIRKPGKLQGRICHAIHEVFVETYLSEVCPFRPEDSCIPITGTGVESLKEDLWSNVEKLATRGFGLLVIAPDGTKFFAETEAEKGHPSLTYSGVKRLDAKGK